MSLWLYEYVWIMLLYGHPVYFIFKVLAWEICIIKWGFAKKVIIKSQRQFMYGSNFYESDVSMTLMSLLFKWRVHTVGFWCQTILKKFLQRSDTIFGLKMMMKSLKCYMKRTILIEFLYIPHKYNGMCYVRLALLFLLFEKESRPY